MANLKGQIHCRDRWGNPVEVIAQNMQYIVAVKDINGRGTAGVSACAISLLDEGFTAAPGRYVVQLETVVPLLYTIPHFR
jgi:hypothetical protein